MEPTNKTLISSQCVRYQAVIFTCTLAAVGLPVNFLLYKILIYNFKLRRPRHKILLSLTISDCIQISFVAFIQLVLLLARAKTSDIFCQVLRKIGESIAVMTVATSSGTIVALSVERFVACLYCFHLHRIISHQRVLRALCLVWLFGVVCGLSDKERYQTNFTSNNFPLTTTFCIMYGVIVIASTVILAYTQITLYLVARRLIKNHPSGSFGSNAEANDLRRAQLKGSIAASGVVMLYAICMCPLAIYIFVMAFKELDNQSNVRLGCLFLVQINTFLDPFVYGLGMEDTRQLMCRDLRRVKSFFQDILNHHVFNFS